MGGLGNENRWGMKTEEKKRGQRSTGAIRGGGLHIDMRTDQSINRFFFLPPLKYQSVCECVNVKRPDVNSWGNI